MSSPFDPPEAASGRLGDEDFADEIHDEMIRARFPQLGFGGCFGLFGVFLLLGAALMVLTGLIGGTVEGLGAGCGVGACYGAMSLIYLVPAVLLLRSTLTLGGVVDDRRQQVLEAVKLQRQFWQALGLAILLFIGLYAFLGVVAITTLGANLAETFDSVAEEIDR